MPTPSVVAVNGDPLFRRAAKLVGAPEWLEDPRFASDKLLENANTLLNAVVKAKPAAAKGKYVRSVTICSTMGPGVALDVTPYNQKAV